MDPSQIPKDVLRVLQDRQLSMAQKMMAFNLLIPDLPAEPKHAQAYEDNLKVGEKIKKLVDEGKIRLGKFDENFNLEIETVA